MSQQPENAPASRVRPSAAPETAETAKRPHRGLSPFTKALVASVLAVSVLGGAGFALDAVAAPAPRSQSVQAAASGPAITHDSTSHGGAAADTAEAVAAVKTLPVDAAVPVAAQQKANERIGTISIPKLWGDTPHFVVEGENNVNLALPGTDDPNAVANFETAIAHNTGTQTWGDLGNTVLEGHRTSGTFGKILTLQHGDPISVTDATGTTYTYAVTKTVQDNPDTVAYLTGEAARAYPDERGLPYRDKAEQYKASSVMDPIPFHDDSISTPGHPAKNPATQRLLTLTSCGIDPATTLDWHVYVIAELQSVTPGTAAK